MAELGKFFVFIGSKFDAKGFQKARDQINKIGLAAGAMAAALTFAGLKAAKAAGIQEEAELTLAQAMKQAGTFTEEAYRHNLEYASSLQKMTTYGDEAILGVQKMLTNFGVEGEMLDQLTKATLDLAAAKGMDLKAAADLVAKSVGSSTNALSRYGITVEGTVGSTERAEMAVQNITALFGGAAQAKAKTYLGQVEQLRNRWGDFVERIGVNVIPVILQLINIISTQVLPKLENWINRVNESGSAVQFLSKGLQILIKILAGIKASFDIAGTAVTTFFLALTGNYRAAKLGLDELKQKVLDYGMTLNNVSNMSVTVTQTTEQRKRDIINTFAEGQKAIIMNVAQTEQQADIQTLEQKKVGMTEYMEEFMMQKQEEEKIIEQSASKISLAFSGTLADMMKGQLNFSQGLKQIWKDLVNFIISELARVIAKLIVIQALKATIGGGFLGKVLGFQRGGIVPGPIGQPRLALVHGGERIIPTQEVTRNISNAMSLVVNVPPISTRQEARRMGEIVGDAIFRKVKHSRRII